MKASLSKMTEDHEQTRSRLIDAARDVFARDGFQAATVREICRIANANVSAVNYHFGSKDELFAEALNFNGLKALQQSNSSFDACPEVRLRQFIEDFMQLLLDENNASRQYRIMAREMAYPTPALDKIVVEAIAPLHAYLGKLVIEITACQMLETQLRGYVLSLIGQCVFYRNSYPVLQRLNPELHYNAVEIKAIAQHISDFSLAALRAVRA
jgi:AcrR family transcriptional regulator